MKNVMNIIIKKKITGFRELVWPLLEPLVEDPLKSISEADCMWNDNEIDMLLQYAERYYESEEKRKQEVESKSTIFIGTFGVATAILINLTKDMIFNSTVPYTPFRMLLIFMLTSANIYLCRAIWFSIKALERREYHTMGFPNFMITNRTDKKKQIIIRYYNNTKKNQNEINIKVDYMTMAQEYFKRAIVVVALFSCIVFIYYIFSYKTIMKDILNAIDSLNINHYILIGVFGCLCLLFILVTILFNKIKKIERADLRE